MILGGRDGAPNANATALAHEMETAQSIGRRPHHVCYCPYDPLLDCADPAAPFNWVCEIRAEGVPAMASRAAAVAGLLCDPAASTRLLDEMASVWSRPEVNRQPDIRTAPELSVHAVSVAPRLLAELTRDELVTRLLGRLLQAGSDGDPPAQVSDWVAAATPGTLASSLLAAIRDPAATGGFADAVTGQGVAAREMLQAGFAAEIDRLVAATQGGALPALRLVLSRIEDGIQRRLPSDRTLSAVIADAAGQIKATIAGLETWHEAIEAGIRQLRDGMKQRQLSIAPVADGGHTSLSTILTTDDMQAHVEQAVRLWLQASDAAQALALPQLVYGLRQDAMGTAVVVRCNIATHRILETADQTISTLREDAIKIALLPGLPSLDGSLAILDANARWRLARGVPVAIPAPVGELVAVPDGKKALPDFVADIPPIVGTSRRIETVSTATSTLWLAVWGASRSRQGSDYLPLVQVADVSADLWRRRTKARMQIQIGSLAPPLRMALTRTDRLAGFLERLAAGTILRGPDESGQEQWFDGDRARFLTRGAHTGLADAVFAYVFSDAGPVTERQPPEAGGTLLDLSQLYQRNWTDADRLVLAVLSTVREWQ